MVIKSLKIEYKGIVKEYYFKNNNIIKSDDNSVGKSTLLRMMFWALGYPIPGTYKIKFRLIRTKIKIHNKKGDYLLSRYNDTLDMFDSEGKLIESFYLNTDKDKLFSFIWGIGNKNVIDNILGAIYIDQDKGWTLLNRGTVIGSIRFNAKELLLGLSGSNSEEYIKKLKIIENTIKKTNALLNLSEYVSNHSGENYAESDEEMNQRYYNLKLRSKSLKKKINERKKIKAQDNSTMKYLLDSKLMIMVDETPITVTKDNLMNFDDNIDLLDSSIRYMEKELSQITCDMEKIESKFQDDINTLFREDDVVDYALNEISKIPLNYAALKEKKDQMLETKKKLNEKIEMILSYENDIKQDTVNWIKIFEEKLNVDDQLKNRPDLFTSDIKS